jgi:ABC-2 type transport system ATP-binding protein
MPDPQWRAQVGYFTELLGMGEFLDQPVRLLSLGQRMRGDLAAAMLYSPRILYLDEPTVGLDVVAKDQIRTFIREVNEEQGTTVILTTHDLDDVERLCRRALLIDRGRMVYDGDLDTLKAKYAPHRELVVQLTEPADVVVPGAEQVAREDTTVRLRFDPAILSAAELIRQVLADFPIKDLSLVEPGLDGVIRAVYADSTAAA